MNNLYWMIWTFDFSLSLKTDIHLKIFIRFVVEIDRKKNWIFTSYTHFFSSTQGIHSLTEEQHLKSFESSLGVLLEIDGTKSFKLCRPSTYAL